MLSPLIIIEGVGPDLDVEAAKRRRIAELQMGGERWEIIFDPVEVIFTGVPRPPDRHNETSGDVSEPLSDVIYKVDPTENPQRAPVPERPEPESAPRYVRIQIRPGNGADDAGEIAEGELTMQGNQLRLYLGPKTYSKWLRPTDDPESVARRLLRMHCGRTGFNGPLRDWPRGIV